MERIVLSAGGTGGHVFPALAVADELRRRYPQAHIVFVGGEGALERRCAEREELPFLSLPARGILGKGVRSLGAFLWIGRSLVRCSSFYRSFRPQVVVGFGSYAAFVPVWLARRKRIPTAIHEQNNRPGVTNKILGKRVERIFLTFPDEEGSFASDKVVQTGNPVRGHLLRMAEKEKIYTHEGGKNLLAFGGSQGASVLNRVIANALPTLRSLGINIMHQTGQEEYEQVKEEYRRQKMDDSLVCPFIEDIGQAYGWADLVVSRAGASTLAELTVLGKPSILIPFPYATHAHQLDNAKYLERHGAAYVLEQSYLDEVNLTRMIRDLLSLPGKLREMGRAARKLSSPRASEHIVDELEKLCATAGRSSGRKAGEFYPAKS